MSGRIAGVQSKVKAIQPKAIYTHCYAHCVNLILVEAMSANQHSRNFLVYSKICIHFLKLVHIDIINLKH
jgi:hypothetical protein